MTDKELISKLDAMVKALQKAKKKTDKTSILLDARKDFGDEADELIMTAKFKSVRVEIEPIFIEKEEK